MYQLEANDDDKAIKTTTIIWKKRAELVPTPNEWLGSAYLKIIGVWKRTIERAAKHHMIKKIERVCVHSNRSIISCIGRLVTHTYTLAASWCMAIACIYRLRSSSLSSSNFDPLSCCPFSCSRSVLLTLPFARWYLFTWHWEKIPPAFTLRCATLYIYAILHLAQMSQQLE